MTCVGEHPLFRRGEGKGNSDRRFGLCVDGRLRRRRGRVHVQEVSQLFCYGIRGELGRHFDDRGGGDAVSRLRAFERLQRRCIISVEVFFSGLERFPYASGGVVCWLRR